MQQSMRKEKLRKFVLCSITDSFMKPFKMIIIFYYYFASSFTSQFLLFWNQDGARNIKRKNWDREIAWNGKLQHLIQKIIIISLLKKCVLYLIKVNHERSLWFVVVPTSINWSKTNIFADYKDEIYDRNLCQKRVKTLFTHHTPKVCSYML